MNIVENINFLYIGLLIAVSIYFLHKGHKGRQQAQVLKFRNYHRQAWLVKHRPSKAKFKRDKF